MTRLAEAMQALRVDGHISRIGRWLELHVARCRAFVAEAREGEHYVAWCDARCTRAVEMYNDPVSAILAALRRADMLTNTEDVSTANNA